MLESRNTPVQEEPFLQELCRYTTQGNHYPRPFRWCGLMLCLDGLVGYTLPVYGDDILEYTSGFLELDSLSSIVIEIGTGMVLGDKASWKRTSAPRCAGC